MANSIAVKESQSIGTMPRALASSVLALYIALFMSGASNYASAGTATDGAIFALAYYGIYGLAACLALLALVRGFLSYKAMMVAGTIVLIALVPVFQAGDALDSPTKNYLVSVITLCIFPCAARFAGRKEILTFAATMTCVLSLISLLDACFLDGMTNTTGRAAGMLINPNVSALALILFATASVAGVPLSWRPAFLMLVASAVMVSFSRSSMLVGFCTLVAAIPAMLRRTYPKVFLKQATVRVFAVALIFIFFCVCAFANNKAFGVAAGESFGGVRTAFSFWQSIRKQESVSLLAHSSDSTVHETSGFAAGETPLSQRSPSQDSNVTPQLVAEAEHENSAVARGVVAQRALDEYKRGPSSGRGLSFAFLLVPHNSFLLFAVAFGILGWFIIPALIAGLAIALPWRTSLPLAVLIFTGSFFSHDLYLSVPLVAGLVMLLISVSTPRSAALVGGNSHRCERFPFVAASAVTLASALLVFSAQYPGRRTTFDVAKDVIRPLSGYAYYVVLPPADPKGLMRIEGVAQHQSSGDRGLEASEDGRPLGPVTPSMADVVQQGAGRYGYENMWFFFSSTDGSDPTQNAKSYQLTTLQSPHPLFYFILVILLGWCVFLLIWSIQENEVRSDS